MSDGTSLNAKLAAMMPIRWEDGTGDDPEYPQDRMMSIEFDVGGPMTSSATVTVKPSLNRYPMYTNGGLGLPVFGQLGQEATFDADLSDGNLVAFFGVADSDSVDTSTEILNISMRVNAEG